MAYATQARFEAPAEIDDRSAAGVPAASGAFRLSIHEELAGLEAEWRAFEKTADCTPFQTFDWLSAWQRHVGVHNGARPAVVMVRDQAGRLLLILPLAIIPGRLARRLTWLGSDLCDYNAPLIAPDFATHSAAANFVELWQDMVARLQSHPQLRYDFIDLEKMPQIVGSQANPVLALGAVPHPRGAFLTKLADNWETYYAAKRSSATRRRDRTKRNRLGDFGEVRFVNAESVEHITDTLNILMVQKARSLNEMGATNIFALPGYPEFYRDVATSSRALVHVSRLDVGSEPAAINLGLQFRDTYYHVLASYADGEVARFGPGVAHLHDLLRRAMERGHRIFDFTIGDERYKRDWCDVETTLYDRVTIATVRGALAAAPKLLMRAVKGSIRRNPKLLDWAKQVRARIGALRR